MPCFNKPIGNYGEELAQNYIKNIGFTILDTNYNCKLGEIDIVAKDKNYICFIEVKTRFNKAYGNPSEAITLSKQKTLYKVAQVYICHKKIKNYYFRFDVIEVLGNTLNNDYKINLIKDAFQINF
jgi:putative endonuclease